MNCKYCGKEVRIFKMEGMKDGIPEPCDCEGYTKAANELAARDAWEEAQKALQSQKRGLRDSFRECMLPADVDLSGFTFKSFNADTDIRKAMLKAAQDFATGFTPKSRGLFFMGTPGTGKTHLSLAIQAALHDRAVCLFTTPGKLFDRLHLAYKGGGTMSSLMMQLARVPLLILDDIDKFSAMPDQFGGSWSHERLFEIINDRSIRQAPIIATSNLPAPELEKKLTPPIFSRLRGMTNGVIGDGPDYRRNK